jgi:hypothetical protein
MKKILAIALLATASSVALADNDAGCGLGSMVWAGQSGVAPKILAATTNGTSGNQTFGITSGTLGCQADGVIASAVRLNMFMGTNSERLARDMSAGQGESLDVLANLMNIKTEDKGAFFQAAKVNFGKIFAPENQTAGQVLAALQQVMAKDAVLSAYQAS